MPIWEIPCRQPRRRRCRRQLPGLAPITTSAHHPNPDHSDWLHCHRNSDFLVMGKLEHRRWSVLLFRHLVDDRLRRHGPAENVSRSRHPAVRLLRLSGARSGPRCNVLQFAGNTIAVEMPTNGRSTETGVGLMAFTGADQLFNTIA